MYSIKLNDGTVIPADVCGLADGKLWIHLQEHLTLGAAAYIFTDDNASHIEFHYGEMTDTYEGYTGVVSFNNASGNTQICLAREAD